jgi:hypothetical protein
MTEDTLQARWEARTVPADDGHVMWQGSPWMRFHGALLRPARVAFTLRTGRQPEGPVWADCGVTGCVAPRHVEDRPGRQRARGQLRAVRGLPPRPAVCAHGHDQDVHGRLDEGGRAYCNKCAGSQGVAA